MMIDTHAHLNFNAYKDDADEVIRRSLDNDVWIINVGSTYETSKRAVEMAEKHEQGVYAAIGLHPIHLAEGIFKTKLDTEEIAFKTQNEDFDYEKYKALAKSESRLIGGPSKRRVVAIGEIGLDYYYRPKTKTKLEVFKEKQRETFLKEIDLAKELNLPIIFHCRTAHDELIEILGQYGGKLQGVIHCFSGDWQQAEKYLDMGFYLGFNGIIFKLNLDEVIEKISLNKILVETDCPYLTPPPMIGRNEPIYVKYVAERIAKIRKLSYEEILEVTTENAKKLFNI
ncbi:MAG: TatD family hydrolase [Candidatus Pacebacteria bacterium]|nr:TatD family hydrolase [Candidatus Paceibacterota bacterium]